MKMIIGNLLVGALMVARLISPAQAFQTASSTRSHINTQSKETDNPTTQSCQLPPPRSIDSRLFEAASDNQDVNSDNDIDGQRRRQLLFSMLYGGAAALVGGPEEATAATETLVEDATTIAKPVSTGLLRPPKDDRDYLAYTLDNGLRILLCSDPNSNEAAAAMDVHVGACSDPVEVPGMAHFCGT